MANVETLVNDPDERQRFIQNVLCGDYKRVEPKLNRGIKTPEELRDLICREPTPFEELGDVDEVFG
ncbi:MAG: hypothetical protein HQL39_19705 [Alphaproteobacteria bacterium]|nr:hypothetical protein [Alphaproteobacteria bacterium]